MLAPFSPILNQPVAECQPQKIGLEVELKLVVKHVELALLGAHIRDADTHVHEDVVLSKVEMWRQHWQASPHNKWSSRSRFSLYHV